jgi:hypothetical protein
MRTKTTTMLSLPIGQVPAESDGPRLLASCPSRLDLLAVHTSFVLSRLGGFGRSSYGAWRVWSVVGAGARSRTPMSAQLKWQKAEGRSDKYIRKHDGIPFGRAS